MVELTPTRSERSKEAFEEVRLTQVTAAIREDGFAVIGGVVDHAHLDTLRNRMEEDLLKIRALSVVPHNFVWGNIQQDPPPYADFIFRDVVANPFVCQVTSTVLGPGAYINGISGNTNVPESQLQPVHVDEGQLWPDLETAHPAARLVVNVALDDTTEENGAIELWPGTHLEVRKVKGEDIRVSEEALEARRSTVPPILGSTKRGDVLVRDMRLWHRGTPNSSDASRFMIAMVHNVAWLKRASGCRLDRACASVFEGCAIENTMPFVEDTGEDYLERNKPYAYDGPN